VTISTGSEVSKPHRIVSGVLVALAFGAGWRLALRGPLQAWQWLVVVAILGPWCLLFGYAAVMGKAPRWLGYKPPTTGKNGAL